MRREIAAAVFAGKSGLRSWASRSARCSACVIDFFLLIKLSWLTLDESRFDISRRTCERMPRSTWVPSAREAPPASAVSRASGSLASLQNEATQILLECHGLYF